MHPAIICAAGAEGMIYLNGRFAGEVSGERPLYMPVAPYGAVYIEFRPLTGASEGVARRLVLSGGMPLAERLENADGLWCVAWPNGALELEISTVDRVVERFALEGLPCALVRGEATTLVLNGAEVALPPGAGLPRLMRLDGAAALIGDVEGGGQYLAAMAPDLSEQHAPEPHTRQARRQCLLQARALPASEILSRRSCLFQAPHRNCQS